MKVILLEDVIGAGNAGDVVEVANGYARNKLLPSGLAIEANKTNMKTLEHRRAKIAAKKTADKEMAQVLAGRIDGKQVSFTAKAGDSGKLFGSITAHDIADAVNKELGFEIDRRKLILDAPLKEVGLHNVRYRIYPEVEATINVNILSEGAPVKAAIIEEEAAETEDGIEGEAGNETDMTEDGIGESIAGSDETGESADESDEADELDEAGEAE